MIRISLLMFVLAGLSVKAFGQMHDTIPQIKQWKGAISFFNHSVSLPFYKIIRRPIHPGMQISCELKYFDNLKNRIYQDFNTGFFYNRYNGTGYFIKTYLAYRYTSRHQIFAEVLIGAGYLRIYHPTAIYSLQDDGTYQKVSDRGFSSFLADFALGIGYDLKSNSRISLSPFIRYGAMIQTRYTPALEVFPHAAFHLGIRANIKTRPDD